MESGEALTDDELSAVAYAALHLDVIAYIDRHLAEPLDVDAIARAVGYSASQFSRRFTHQQGESVMAYVRGCRLEAAAKRVVDGDTPLIELAFDAGFDSQEAFTRAFARAFDCTPGELRRRRGPVPIRRRRNAAAVDLEERTEDVPELVLVGLRHRFTRANYKEMGPLWERVIALRAGDGFHRRAETFGVFLAEGDAGELDYFAGAPGRLPASPPLETCVIPAGRYLVCRQALSNEPLLAQTSAARLAIATTAALPIAFQRYPERFAIENRWIDHYVRLGERVTGDKRASAGSR